MSKMSRRKGATAELEIAHILRASGWPNAGRTSDSRTQAGRGDIANGPEGVHIEIKRRERLDIPGALRQTMADADPLDVPILMHRSNHQPWLVTLPLLDLLPLLQLKERA